MITLVVITDGRWDCITQTIPSALTNLQGPITRRIIYDDSGDALNRSNLHEAFPTFTIAHSPEGRRGFGGAIRFMWQYLAAWDTNPYVFWLEDDFLFNRTVKLEAMMSVLNKRPHLMQLALRRQPWNDQEKQAGGIVEMNPESYVDCHDGIYDWLEHSNFFTTNPSLFPRKLCEKGWPPDPHSEGRFGALIREADPEARFGYWGARDSGEWVEHIGRQRVGTGY